MMNLLLLKAGYVWLIVLAVIFVLVAVVLGIVPVNLWIKAFLSKSHVSATRLAGMRLRRINAGLLVNSYINAKKAGVLLTMDDLESHYSAGGDVERIVDAMIAAKGANLNLSIETAKAIDLANRDILTAVKNSVSPVVIETPEVSAMARDGIELKIKARLTLKSNISKLIGGAGTDTIIARVGQGIVTAVGAAKSHLDIMERPETISESITAKKLEKDSAFDIMSIDIADIKVGRNIGAQLEADRAEADMQIAQARAEERRALAIATEQEMRVKTQEKRAQLLDAQAEIPKAISTALRAGQLGVMDYYKMQNVLADTNMRNSLSGSKDREDNTIAPKEKDKEGN